MSTVLYLILSYLILSYLILSITTTLNEELQGYLSGVGAGGLCYSFRKIENYKICQNSQFYSSQSDLQNNFSFTIWFK